MATKYVCGETCTEKGSKFFGVLAQVDNVMQFNDFMAEIKKEHRKASHYCSAYNIHEKTLIGENMKQKYSNDGEPSGCGNALLTLLKSNKLENHAVIVVRYFGGALLGSGNLFRAYATAGKAAIAKNIS